MHLPRAPCLDPDAALFSTPIGSSIEHQGVTQRLEATQGWMLGIGLEDLGLGTVETGSQFKP